MLGTQAAQLVENKMIVGLGTGSTSRYFIEALAQRIEEEKLEIKCVTSSFASQLLAREGNMPVVPIGQVQHMDLYVDGADEVDPEKCLIKGRGGAMVQEKILASMSKKFVVIVDNSKLVKNLGEKFSVPVECIPDSLNLVMLKLTELNSTPVIRIAEKKDGPVISDQGNFIIDAKFSAANDFKVLDKEINQIPGVLGHGIFVNLAHSIYTNEGDSLKVL